MADSLSASNSDYSEQPIDDDDPLMELSRIIGLEPRRDPAPRREMRPLPGGLTGFEPRNSPVVDVEPVMEPQHVAQAEISDDLQRDLADELIASLEAEDGFSADDADSELISAAVDVDSGVAETTEEPFSAYPIEPLEEDAAVPHLVISKSEDLSLEDLSPEDLSLEDQLSAMLGGAPRKEPPFGLRPVDAEAQFMRAVRSGHDEFAAGVVEPSDVQAELDDPRIDMNFDAQPLPDRTPEELTDDLADDFHAPLPEPEWMKIRPAAAAPDAGHQDTEPLREEEPFFATLSAATEMARHDETGGRIFMRSFSPAAVVPVAEMPQEPDMDIIPHEARNVEVTGEIDVPDFEYGAGGSPAPRSYEESGLADELADKPVARQAVGIGRHAPASYDDSELAQINDAIAELGRERYEGAVDAHPGDADYAAAALQTAERDELLLNDDGDFVQRFDAGRPAGVERKVRGVRPYLMAAGLGCLALLGGIGAYALTRSDGGTQTAVAPVVLKADAAPVKIAPETPGGKVIPNQDIAVYDKAAGDKTEAAPQETLVTKTVEPVDLKEKTAARVVLPGPSATVPLEEASTEPAAKSEERAAVDTTQDATPIQSELASVSPKRVRTMVVKSDGSLVERKTPAPAAADETAAIKPLLIKPSADGAVPAKKVQTEAVLPTAATVAPAAADAAKTEVPVETAAAALEPEAAAPAPVEASAAPQAEPVRPVVKTVKIKKITQKSAKLDKVQEIAAVNVPLVDARPSDQPVTIVAKTGRTPLADTAAAAPQGGGYVIQIASAPSADAAQSTYASLSRKFGGVIGGKAMNIQQAEIPGKGTFYRVRIAAGSKQAAAALCAKYKSAGGQCLVAK